MTVYKREKVTNKLDTNQDKMSEGPADVDSPTAENLPESNSPELNEPIIDSDLDGDEISLDDLHSAPFYTISPPNGFVPFTSYYVDDWTTVDHLFNLPMQPEEAPNSSSSRTPPPPMAFGISGDNNAEDESHEEDVQGLVDSFDRIVVTEPNENQPHMAQSSTVQGVSFVQVVDVYTEYRIIPKTTVIAPSAPDDPRELYAAMHGYAP